MLDEIRSERSLRIVFRLSRVTAYDDQFFPEMGLDDEKSRKEMSALLIGRLPSNPIEELIDEPFRPKKKLRNGTRFSDGSFPVFYSSLEAETAEAEVAYWFRKVFAGTSARKRTAYYQGFHCTFEGLEKDLRRKTMDWPELVHEKDYSFCNLLGAEAREKGIDGLIVPSTVPNWMELWKLRIVPRRTRFRSFIRLTITADDDSCSLGFTSTLLATN